jgi:hypothetical protein
MKPVIVYAALYAKEAPGLHPRNTCTDLPSKIAADANPPAVRL